MRLIATAASGVRAQQLALDTIGDNMSNVNTTGFKERNIDFAETLAVSNTPDKAKADNKNAVPVSLGSGVLYRNTYLNTQQGELVNTENPLDLAINGAGFFPVITGDGKTAYTRAGIFKIDYFIDPAGQKIGKIIDNQGNILKINPVKDIPQDIVSVSVSEDGQIRGIDAKDNTFELGQIKLAKFIKPEMLASIGGNLFTSTSDSGPAVEHIPGIGQTGKILPNTIEQSNVKLSSAMAELIQVQRAYQLNVRMVQNGDKMWEMANSLRR